MKQFTRRTKIFHTLSTGDRNQLVAQSCHFSRCKFAEEREFYLMLCKNENYTFREFDRQISSSLFERFAIGNQKLSTVLIELRPVNENVFKETYVFEFFELT